MRQIAARFMQHLLTPESNQFRLNTATDLLQCAESDADFLKSIETGDESRVDGYDPETKAQSSV